MVRGGLSSGLLTRTGDWSIQAINLAKGPLRIVLKVDSTAQN